MENDRDRRGLRGEWKREAQMRGVKNGGRKGAGEGSTEEGC